VHANSKKCRHGPQPCARKNKFHRESQQREKRGEAYRHAEDPEPIDTIGLDPVGKSGVVVEFDAEGAEDPKDRAGRRT
jgi:hypothetical protein